MKNQKSRMIRRKFAENLAREIGQSIAEDGHAQIKPWLSTYSYWPDAVAELGPTRATIITQLSFDEARSEQEFPDNDDP